MYAYTSDLGPVECRAEATSDGRFSAVVILIHRIEDGHDVLRHMCPGSDAESADAVAKARAWAEKTYPPRPANAARIDAA
jgi:hypothetical protein